MWLACLVSATQLSTDAADLMWSAQPLSEATLHAEGVWEPVKDTNITLQLNNEAEVLVSYSLATTAERRSSGVAAGSDLFASGLSLSGAGQRNFLQARLLINGVPYRQSSSHASPGLSMESNSDTLTGHAAVNLGPGAHDVQLQWKKLGAGVAAWGSRPSVADGFAGGRSIVVTARHRYIWHTHADSIARIDAEGSWVDVPGTSLDFTLPDSSSLRFLYSMTVRSDQVDGQNGVSGRSRDSISARLTVDGVPYRESGAAFSLTSTSFASGVLERDFMLELQAGKHSVVVQWRKWGDTVRSWRSNPALLDGYASARFLAVMGERQSVLAAPGGHKANQNPNSHN